MTQKLILAVIAVFITFVALPAYACNDEHHGHPKGQKCDRDITVEQGQGQDQQQGQTTQVTANPTANSNSQSGAAANSNSAAAANSNSASAANSAAQSGSNSAATNGDQTSTVGVATQVTTGGSTATGGDQATNVTTGDVKTGDASSSSTSAGGAGGEGGAGGSAAGGNAEGGKSEMNDSGNGGGAVVNNTSSSVSNQKTLVFSPVQPPPLPTTIAVGGISLVKSEECGPRVRVKPFNREAHVPMVFGLWQKSVDVQTMHGTLDGFDDENPFIVRRFMVPAPYNREVVMVIGHQLYIAVGWDGQGGGSSGAGSYAGDKAMGVGLGLSANSSLGVVGVVALPCVYDPSKSLQPIDLEVTVKKAEVAPQPTLDVAKVRVKSDEGKYVRQKKVDKKQLCGAAEDEECVWSSTRVEVVKDAKIVPGDKK